MNLVDACARAADSYCRAIYFCTMSVVAIRLVDQTISGRAGPFIGRTLALPATIRTEISLLARQTGSLHFDPPGFLINEGSPRLRLGEPHRHFPWAPANRNGPNTAESNTADYRYREPGYFVVTVKPRETLG